jgi:transcriptional regulator with XRE-family HTH domain
MVGRTRKTPERKTPEKILMGRRLKAVRDRSGMTQEEVADRLAMTATNYGHYEQGVRKIEFGDVPRFAAALKIEPGSLSDELLGQPARGRGDEPDVPAEDPRLRSIYVQLSNGLPHAQPKDRSFVYRSLELFAQRFGLGSGEVHGMSRARALHG